MTPYCKCWSRCCFPLVSNADAVIGMGSRDPSRVHTVQSRNSFPFIKLSIYGKESWHRCHWGWRRTLADSTDEHLRALQRESFTVIHTTKNFSWRRSWRFCTWYGKYAFLCFSMDILEWTACVFVGFWTIKGSLGLQRLPKMIILQHMIWFWKVVLKNGP